MLFTMLPLFLLLGLSLLGGLLIGLGLRSDGRKWHALLVSESKAYSAYRRNAAAQLRRANDRIAKLERQITKAPASAASEEQAGPITAPKTRARRGKASLNEGDDLSHLRGIDAPLKDRLSALGVTRFADIEELSAEDEMALEQRLTLPAGLIAREQWREQAALLRIGNDKEHRKLFPTA